MQIKSFVFNPFYENTYVLWDDTHHAIIVDPGCYEKFECEELIDFVEGQQLQVQLILNTHCHIDHVLGNEALKRHFQCPLHLPEKELDNFRAVAVYAPNYGMQRYTPAEPDVLLATTGEVHFGQTTLKIIAAPGHSPGHLVFYHERDGVLIGGDVLFRGSVGRTDLPGGNTEQLARSIREGLYTLPDATVVFPGHGPETTIGFEKMNNPFVRA